MRRTCGSSVQIPDNIIASKGDAPHMRVRPFLETPPG